jgi:ABC-type antimicrobial peptide transport system permease subunit
MIEALIEREIKHSSQLTEVTSGEKQKKNWREKLNQIKTTLRSFFTKQTVIELRNEGKVLLSLLGFMGLVFVFLFDFAWRGVHAIFRFFRLPARLNETVFDSTISKLVEMMVGWLEVKQGVKRSFLIGLAFRNMRVKKMRSMVTVGGVALGIGAIVFLVSLGYGVQRLVVSRVARLDDLRMADVLIGKTGLLRLDESALSNISRMTKVEKVLPIVTMVGKTEFRQSVSEVVTYGVEGDYMKLSSLNLVKGQYFTSNVQSWHERAPEVAGVVVDWEWESAERGKVSDDVDYNFREGVWMRVRSGPSIVDPVLGYTKRREGGFAGQIVWGDNYRDDDGMGASGMDGNGQTLGKWLKSAYPIWQKQGNEYVEIRDGMVQDWREGYVASINVEIEEKERYRVVDGAVLGETTDDSTASAVIALSEDASVTARVVGRDEYGVEWVELDDGLTQEARDVVVPFGENLQAVAVVNTAFLQATGIDLNNSIGEVFRMNVLMSSAVKSSLVGAARSSDVDFRIVGVVDAGNSPSVYLPIDDVMTLGVDNFSQVKLVVAHKNDLDKVRQQIDGLGYRTSSVADTVAQIDRLFATVRVVLASFGFVALAVASLGMFNTMTVSLMERTHEVGVMKAMGMTSSEVKELFMAEAMVMGILGGVFGVGAGVLAGYLLSAVLSIFAIANGVGWVSVSYVPGLFVTFVLLLSFGVGILTGIYPAKRATKISALDALRYE